MLRPYRLLAAVLALGAAPGAFAQTEPETAPAVRSVNYACDTGEKISVSYEGRGALLVDSGGRSFRLEAEPAAFGIAYAGRGQALRGRGAEIEWTPTGMVPRACREVDIVTAAGSGFRLEGSELVHEATGMRFPAQVAGFARDDARTYDADGQYVAIGYARPLPSGAVIHARISTVHLESMTAAEHYAIIRPGLMNRLPEARVISEGPRKLKRFPNAKGWNGTFSGGAQGAETVALVTVDFGYWSMRLRALFPSAEGKAAESAIGGLVDGLNWRPLEIAPSPLGAPGG